MGMSRGDLAKVLGTDASLVSKWERNESRPRYSSLVKIATALGTSYGWLMGESAEPSWLEGAEGHLTAIGTTTFRFELNSGEIGSPFRRLALAALTDELTKLHTGIGHMSDSQLADLAVAVKEVMTRIFPSDK